VEVELARPEQVPQEAQVAGLVAEAVGDDRRREALYEGRTKGFVSSLPVRGDG